MRSYIYRAFLFLPFETSHQLARRLCVFLNLLFPFPMTFGIPDNKVI